jgi:hypothetical protein
VRLRITGPEPTEVLLWRGWAPEWRATREGREVRLEPALVEGARLMKLRAAPGEVELRFGPSRGAHPAAFLSVLTLLGMAWAARARPRPSSVSGGSS